MSLLLTTPMHQYSNQTGCSLQAALLAHVCTRESTLSAVITRGKRIPRSQASKCGVICARMFHKEQQRPSRIVPAAPGPGCIYSTVFTLSPLHFRPLLSFFPLYLLLSTLSIPSAEQLFTQRLFVLLSRQTSRLLGVIGLFVSPDLTQSLT